MDQISNFREVLGLDRQPSNPVQKQAQDVDTHLAKEKKTSSPNVKQNKKSKETSNDYAEAKTIRVMPPVANDVISMALDALLEGVYPKAKGFVNK